MRPSGPADGPAVVLLGGGVAAERPGDWNASIAWLVDRLAPRFPDLRLCEVRYRVRSWKRLDLCSEDALAAVAAVRGRGTLVVGFSTGAAAAIGAAGDPDVTGVVGLAPWLPERLDLEGLRGRRLVVIQGSLDGLLPGIPGIRPAGSRAGAERARAAGAEVDYTLIRGAVHGVALRSPAGGLVPLPRAGAWRDRVAAELERFRAGIQIGSAA